jgi:hypothetical protein
MRRCHAAAGIAVALVLCVASVDAAPDENDVYVLTSPERSMEQVDAAYAGMPAVKYEPPADRWGNLPRTAAVLRKGEGRLRVVMLGDSIVNDTSRSRWEDVLARLYPRVKVTKVTCVRGSTGCWWYKAPGRVQRYVLDHEPDLLVIGGISQRDDVDSVREVIGQVRARSACDVLLMTGAFGAVDPGVQKQAGSDTNANTNDFDTKLKRLAVEVRVGFLDMGAHWRRYVRESGREVGWFKRDAIHANDRGEQILGRLLAAHLAPPVGGESRGK